MATWESIVIKYSMYNCYSLKNSKVLSHPCTDSKRWSHSYPICSLIGLAFRHPLPRHCKGRKSRTGSTMIGLKIAWFKYVKLWWKTTELFVSRFLALWYDLGLIRRNYRDILRTKKSYIKFTNNVRYTFFSKHEGRRRLVKLLKS